MAKNNLYFMLVASLPPLVSFERLPRLPISPERLESRMRMLAPEDVADEQDFASIFLWQKRAGERTDAGVVADYDRLIQRVRHPWLRRLLSAAADQRTIVVALRRRRLGRKPRPGERWGVGGLTAQIERNWDVPDFKLSGYYPWIPEAEKLLREGQTLALELLLTRVFWKWATRSAEGSYFGFDAVLAYLMKWKLAQLWLSYNSPAARTRFEELVKEMLDENKRILGEAS